MSKVRPKKHLGQHFLLDEFVAEQITNQLSVSQNCKQVVEIGAGMGVLTKYLMPKFAEKLLVVEIDEQSVSYLLKHLNMSTTQIMATDVLKLDWKVAFKSPISLIGNFPYNISSPIFFKVLENKDHVEEVVCMIQKEVAQRIASPHKKRTYGILSVFLQTFYSIDYVLEVPPSAFNPPPKVDSAVLHLKRNKRTSLPCSEKFFFKLVKMGFGQRRKKLRNALKSLPIPLEIQEDEVFELRAEQLCVEDFIALAERLENLIKRS